MTPTKPPKKKKKKKKKSSKKSSKKPSAESSSVRRPKADKAGKSSSKSKTKARLIVRQLRIEDIDAVQALHRLAYPTLEPWSRKNLADHLEKFPEGQLAVELDGELVATSSSLIVDTAELGEEHVFRDVCRGGNLTGHDPAGDMLYGIDIAVTPKQRGKKLARRIYDARKDLVLRHNLKGLIFGGRMPRYHEYAEEMSARDYLAAVLRKELRDPVVTAQRANGFTVRALLPNYLPKDLESRGFAVLMEWKNPQWLPRGRSRRNRVRVASVQYEMRPIGGFDAFSKQCEFFVDTASEYRCDIVVFPELLTNQLLALVPSDNPADSARKLEAFTQPFVEFFGAAALRYNINILAGTHLTVEGDTLYNIAYFFHRDGRLSRQYKIHITPSEARWWGVSAGNRPEVFETDCGKLGIAICYDVEFPEYARVLKQKGAEILLVPYNTDIRSGHLRVRACAQARAVENHVYVVTAGATGNLPQVEGADIHYAQSAILTPSDIAFARDGIAAEATPNIETMLVHDLDLGALRKMEATGTVRPWADRRKDLYKVTYQDGDEAVEV